VSSSLGTRHRAAIGITEETDCLALVVSEETGRISVAAFGELAAGLNLREVDERICTHFGVQRSAPHLIEEFAADIPMENHRPERAEPK
jgi:diadenylate cyclase